MVTRIHVCCTLQSFLSIEDTGTCIELEYNANLLCIIVMRNFQLFIFQLQGSEIWLKAIQLFQQILFCTEKETKHLF